MNEVYENKAITTSLRNFYSKHRNLILIFIVILILFILSIFAINQVNKSNNNFIIPNAKRSMTKRYKILNVIGRGCFGTVRKVDTVPNCSSIHPHTAPAAKHSSVHPLATKGR